MPVTLTRDRTSAPANEPSLAGRAQAGLQDYCRILKRRGECAWKFMWQLQRTFRGLTLSGARALDVGAGWGRHTLYFSASGATHVIALEPELDGSSSGVAVTLQEAIERDNFQNIELRKEDFRTAEFPGNAFDVVLMHAVVNHLHQTEEIITSGSQLEALYAKLFAKTHRLLKKDGVLIISDANRHNIGRLLAGIGLKNRLQPQINWRLHQTPRVWQRLLRLAGFRRFELIYYTPFALRHCPWLWGNRLIDFMTYGMFTLRAYA